MDVHRTAVIADGAELGEDVRVGPFCMIGPHVKLGAGCVLHGQVVIEGHTEIGPECELWPQAVLGTSAQHRDDRAEDNPCRLVVGARCQFREHVTVNVGSRAGSGITRIGDDNLLLIGSHVAHDATLGSGITMANGAMVAGHSSVEDGAQLGAMAGLHQFTRVGRLAMVGAGAMVSCDAPPFAMVQGDRARIRGVNLVGLRRAGYGPEDVQLIKRLFRLLFWRGEALAERVERVRQDAPDHPLARELLTFIDKSRRGVLMARA